MISLTGEVGSLRISGTWIGLRCAVAAPMASPRPIRWSVIAALIVEHIDRARVGARELHRTADDGGEHRFEVERRVNSLGHFAKRAQFSDRTAKFIGALAQFIQQPRVLDGKDRLGGETVNELDLFLAQN